MWTTPEGIEEFVRTNFGTPDAYMQMLESLGANAETHAPPLATNRLSVMPVNNKSLAMAAATIEADYLIRDPRPGSQQETMRLPKKPDPEV